MAAKKKFKVPKTLAQCADLLYTTRQARLDIQKQVDELQKQESQLRQHLIDNLPKSQASGVAGRVARATIVTKQEPVIEDEEKFRKYINRTKRFDLAYKLRPSPPAIRDLWDDGKEVPGVARFVNVTVSLNKI